MLLSYLRYKNACDSKQRQRVQRISDLAEDHNHALDDVDRTYLDAPVSTIVANVHKRAWTPTDILRAYVRAALTAHERTNCLTEILVDDGVKAATALSNSDFGFGSQEKIYPLAGVPVSVKDTVCVAGYDACIGYAAWTGRPVVRDSALVRLLRDAGALLYVKTAIPITLLSFESTSAVFGRCTNPHNASYSPGGSSGGEAALLALGGSRVGIGTDVAGSVRVPAHYSGVYAVRASAGRFPKTGNATSMPGQEGVPAVCSPMARTLEDLRTFWEAVFEMEPWKYDHSVLEIPWRTVFLQEGKVKFGVMWDDGVVTLSPACKRALVIVVDNLRLSGYEVVDFTPPDPVLGLRIASQLLLADEGKTAVAPILFGEPNDPGMITAMSWFRLPRFLQVLYVYYVRYVRRDETYASLLEGFREKTIQEYYALIAQREAYRARWFEAWSETGLDFLLTAPNALPAVPNGGMKKGWKVCGHTFLFNLLDYTAGVLPVTKVSEHQDALSATDLKAAKSRNAIARDAFEMYDARAMAGLPVGIQVVGQRLQEEKVLAGMSLVEGVLRKNGLGYELLKL